MQKLFLLFFLLFNLSISGFSQVTNNSDTINIPIINNEKVIKNDMLFDYIFEKIKKPQILVNNEPVYTLAFYNREEFKKITVLQPKKEGYTKYHNKGKNGVIIAELKDDITSPEIEILDHRDTGSMQTFYISADDKSAYINKIKIKNLGVGWDRATIYIKGGMLMGTESYRDVRVSKEGIVTIGITTQTWNKSKLKEITFRAVKLPQ